MTQDERDLITSFIQRVGGPAAPAGGFGRFGGSVPATVQQADLPPVDREADALLADLFTRHPEARYRISQLAFIQEHALVEAQNRINRLEWELNQARAAAAPAPQASPWGSPQAQPQPQQSRGLFGGLFGGNRQAPPPQQPQYGQPQYGQPNYAQQQYGQPPQPQYAPGYQPGMFQQQGRGTGFLGGALMTAAGVAGGMIAGNALMNMFSGGSAHAAGLGSAATGVSDPFAGGGEPKTDAGWSDPGAASGGGWTNATSNSGWDNAPQDSGWTDASAEDSGWTDPDQG